MTTIYDQNKTWLERLTYGPPLSPAELEAMANDLDEMEGIKAMANDLDEMEGIKEVMRDYHCDNAVELEAYLVEQSVFEYTSGQFDEVCAERDGYLCDVEDLKAQIERLEEAIKEM